MPGQGLQSPPNRDWRIRRVKHVLATHATRMKCGDPSAQRPCQDVPGRGVVLYPLNAEA